MARRPWLYTVGGENQIGGFVKEFTNIAFLTVKVGLRGAAEWGHGAAGRAAGRQQGGGERRSLPGGTDTPLLLPVPCREPATWCPRTSPSLPSPCSAASLRMSLSRSCPGCAWCFPAACTRRLPPAWLGLAAAWLCHRISPWLLAGCGSAWQDGSRGRRRGGRLPAGWGVRSPRGSLPAGPCSCLSLWLPLSPPVCPWRQSLPSGLGAVPATSPPHCSLCTHVAPGGL